MKVVLNEAWWHKGTYHKKGSRLEVPEGTSVPSGSIVDGKLIPKRQRGEPNKADRLSKENEELKSRLAALEAKVAQKK